MFEDIITFRIPLFFRLLIIGGTITASVFIAPDIESGLVGAMMFWVIYFAYQSELLYCNAESGFFRFIFSVLWHIGFWVALLFSFGGVIFGVWQTLEAMEVRAIPMCLVSYTLVTQLFCFIRYKISDTRCDEDIADGGLIYWGPIALLPIFCALIARFLLANAMVSLILCLVLVVVAIVYAIINSWLDYDSLDVAGRHKNDNADGPFLSSGTYNAKWERLETRVKGDVFYVEGNINVSYSGAGSFNENAADATAKRLVDKMISDIKRQHPECKSVNASHVVISYDWEE